MKSVFQNILRVLTLCMAILLPSLCAADSFNGEPVEELEWEALMPAGFSLESLLGNPDDLGSLDDLDPQATQYMDQMMAALASAPVVPEMAGKMIKIPGFVVPVQGDGMNVTEFFLVPYFGACIHVPPPPSNQIIYVRFEPGTKVDNLYDAIWVTGKLSTETITHELASSGYSLEAFVIEPYEEAFEAPPEEADQPQQ
ncbi:DUF3299 domain-containing protein [Pontibacterium sp. N1Y112]|uniref:DUF3299 domain-containing protein n=1 Tax=Pontibacterium sinense TaxID=2781979 RepID=A0A8J7FSZ6_9GAMM|nr:DUF3299 domain-containing protein [Pontibacterium sinense]MBE9396675.1 DUF3299 domain-containing protein [Pontibacterium sinense]